MTPDALVAEHLGDQLGWWPPRAPFEVAASPRRAQPGWDGVVRPVHGVTDGTGSTVLGVPPLHLDAVRALGSDWRSPAYGAGLAAVLGLDGPCRLHGSGLFRWCRQPAGTPDTGEWVDRHDPRVPGWLTPFTGGLLLAWDDRGEYGAGVGIKAHDRWADEIAVGTEPALRGRGIARLLVATAAREIARRGRVALYLHAADNTASAHVADAAGFPDEGWRVLGLVRSDTPVATHDG